MQKCPYCKIEVGSDLVKCPLCQSRLTGEPEAAMFPHHPTMQFRSFLYKLQLFIIWVIVIVGLGLDFLIHLKFPAFPDLHWSLILAMWMFVFEFGIMRQFKPGTGSARKVTMMVFNILILLGITSYFFGFFELTLDLIIPAVITGAIIANFVLAMLDKKGNAMAYLLTVLLFGLIPCVVIYFSNKEMPVAWIVCMFVTIILFAAAIIFKGKAVAGELKRRFNL